MRNSTVSQKVLVEFIKTRINELNELMNNERDQAKKQIIRTRISESFDWLLSMGETVEVSK